MLPRLLSLLLLLTTSTLALENDFGFYPKGAQPCLYKAANETSCSGSSAKMNTCLCGNNSNFITNSAKCIGDESPDDVDETYDTMALACNTSGTPISVEKKGFQDAAAEGQAVTTTAAAVTTTSEEVTSATESATATEETGVFTTTTSGGVTITVVPTNSNDEAQEDEGLSTVATVGIAVGAGAAGAAFIGVMLFFLVRRRRRRAEEESHPMLPHWSNNGNNSINGGSINGSNNNNSINGNNTINSAYPPSATNTSPPTEPKPVFTNSPNTSTSDGQWAYSGTYVPPPPPGVVELPPTQMIYEMDGTGTRAEMEGDTMVVGDNVMNKGDMDRRDMEEWRKR